MVYAFLFSKEQGAVRKCLFYLLIVSSLLVCQMYRSITEKKLQKLENYRKMIALFKVCPQTFAFQLLIKLYLALLLYFLLLKQNFRNKYLAKYGVLQCAIFTILTSHVKEPTDKVLCSHSYTYNIRV